MKLNIKDSTKNLIRKTLALNCISKNLNLKVIDLNHKINLQGHEL